MLKSIWFYKEIRRDKDYDFSRERLDGNPSLTDQPMQLNGGFKMSHISKIDRADPVETPLSVEGIGQKY